MHGAQLNATDLDEERGDTRRKCLRVSRWERPAVKAKARNGLEMATDRMARALT